MISTLHGKLPLLVYPAEQLEVSPAGRVTICRIRGEALGQYLNIQVTLDLNSGELVLLSPDGMAGAFRLGDLVAAHVQQSAALALRERQEAEHAARAH